MKFYLAQLDASKLPQPPAEQTDLDKIFSIVYVTIGAIGILIMVIAGVRYITARGEPNKMAEAKNMIVYTLTGLVIAAMAAVLVNYVLNNV